MIRVAGWLGTGIYCEIQLLFILKKVKSKTADSGSREIKAYINTLRVTMAAFVADMFSRAYAELPDSLLFIAVAGTYLKYILIPSATLFYFEYIVSQISNAHEKKVRFWRTVIWVLNIISAIMVISSAWTHWAFYYDAQHIYHRGALYLMPMSVMMLMAFALEITIIMFRGSIEKRKYYTLLAFQVGPLVGGMLQAFLYGLPFSLMGVTFSVFIVYVNIINHDMSIDYLTGAYNRKMLDTMLEDHVEKTGTSFAAIMIDVDEFKKINDTFGHRAGDEALEQTAAILKSALRRGDVICRYGGDEFCIILDSADKGIIDSITERIDERIRVFNGSSSKPYSLSLSLGYGVFDDESRKNGISAEQFMHEIDEKMYRMKQQHHDIMRRNVSAR